MIRGKVNAHDEGIIRLSVFNSLGQGHEFEAIVDTGFNGWLSLSPALITFLELPFRNRGRATLADGSESVFDIYEATVLWDGQGRRIAIDEADTTPLVGMALLHGSELSMQIIDGGEVSIKPLPLQRSRVGASF